MAKRKATPEERQQYLDSMGFTGNSGQPKRRATPEEIAAYFEQTQQPQSNSMNELSQALQRPQTKGWGGVAQDAWQGVKDVPGAALDLGAAAINELPGEVLGLGEQAFKSPLRPFQSAAAGLLGGLQGLGNLPSTTEQYLRDKEILSPGQAWIRPSQIDFKEMLGVADEQPGDALTGFAGHAIPFALGGEAGALSGFGRTAARSAAAGTAAAAEGQNPLTAALMVGAGETPFRVSGKVSNKFSSKAQGQKILDRRQSLVNEFNNLYESLESDAKKAGVDKIKYKPNFDMKELRKQGLSVKTQRTYDQYVKNPTVENLRKLNTAFGDDASTIYGKIQKGTSTPSESDLYYLIKNKTTGIQPKLKGAIYNELSAGTDKTLGNRFLNISKRYGEELGPYLDNPAINKAAANKLRPERLPKKMLSEGGDEFMMAIGEKQFPGLKYSRYGDMLSSTMKSLGPAGVLAYALNEKIGNN